MSNAGLLAPLVTGHGVVYGHDVGELVRGGNARRLDTFHRKVHL